MITEKEDFWKNALSLMDDGLKMKKIMLSKGLRQAKAKCPKCEGYLYATLNGSKNHVHIKCTGSCKRSMME